MMKRVLVSGIVLIVIYLTLSGIAFATYPHGDFASNPDACAACHRMHTATAKNLIKDPNGAAMCNTCHWAGSGADTDVANGTYIDSHVTDHTWGDDTGILLGGGFEKIGGTNATTSHHILDQAIIPPGSVDPDDPGNPGATVTLQCMSCHSPHPEKTHPNQYRLLRLRPNGATTDKVVDWNGPWEGADQQVPGSGDYRAYTQKDFDTGVPGIQYYTNNYKRGSDPNSGITQWCVSCHTKYATRQDTEPYNAGDIFGDVARFRHHTDTEIMGITNQVNGLNYNLTTDLPLNDEMGNGRTDDDKMMCLTCHRGHGTDSSMTPQAALSPGERGSLPVGSMLLRRDNRGVCINCHNNL
ncbi:MAG: hypothetical protein M1335_03450 [Chloroflexi bacterium]|nr:hypothetical protein [Chloroflexota bacterium]